MRLPKRLIRHLLPQVMGAAQRLAYGLVKVPQVQQFIRVGHGAKGTLYGLIGLFAIHDLRYSQQVTGSEGVLLTLGRQYLGSLILGLLALGLLGYVLWRFIQAFFDPGHSEDLDIRQVIQRCAYGISGLAYLGIARTAGNLALGLAIDLDDTVEDLAEVLFERAIGPWLLLGVGCCTVGVGLTYLYGAFTGSYISKFHAELDSLVKRWVIWIGKLGITARGISFILVGSYLIKAAYFLDFDSAGGLSYVFDQLDDDYWGKIWLGAIAFGFIAYAVYMIIAAFYRKFPTLPRQP
ncbi:DUF1206 domain-containing protein [Leptolyngbya sp. CCNP1308]|uniref:DUF1206 domain-containing protein n=1 Tax=Leptolyngbya sp. CCNP1308 TaxID=3110255 RepID=UPI002B1FC215|nr:DUF1206 domain-containing protein [Leptolyngbya sp. CCNP1308]MEA5451530.1 DUF1206 domain-containing protein [Leptolyngbya sp. CCNP1308]